MRRLHRAQHVRMMGEGGQETDVELLEATQLTDEELQAAIDQIELQRLNALRALGIPVND